MSYLTDLEKENKFLKEANIELHKMLKNKETIIERISGELAARPIVVSKILLEEIRSLNE